MRRGFWLQMFAISVFFTALSAAIAVLVFQSIAAKATQESRRNAYLFLANIVESAPFPESLQRYEHFRSDSQTIGRSIWVLSDAGKVYGSNTNEPPPPGWMQIPKPQHRHEISAKIPGLSNFADLVLVRLDKPDPTYLLVRPEKDTPNRAIAGAEIAVFILSLFGTSFAGLTMIFVYLRRTSKEAKQVINQLHTGDLGARFTIGKFDKIGNLKLDFNHMADEIERLVSRIQVTESTRRNLLQELSHDLRTPLTSLKTSVETLAQFQGKMTSAQQQEMLAVAQSELNYFVHLLEDLFFIADLAEPSYKKSLEDVNLHAMCLSEVLAKVIALPRVKWDLQDRTYGETNIAGDPHLLLRLLRNALDNAGKFAKQRVNVKLTGDTECLELTIEDDGPGIAEDAANTFGQRRKHRIFGDSAEANLSLGLGSVIITAIAELHGGSVNISNGDSNVQANTGTILTIKLPRQSR